MLRLFTSRQPGAALSRALHAGRRDDRSLGLRIRTCRTPPVRSCRLGHQGVTASDVQLASVLIAQSMRVCLGGRAFNSSPRDRRRGSLKLARSFEGAELAPSLSRDRSKSRQALTLPIRSQPPALPAPSRPATCSRGCCGAPRGRIASRRRRGSGRSGGRATLPCNTTRLNVARKNSSNR